MSVSHYTSRESQIANVKALGQEVIDRAEDIVGEGSQITDLDVWLHFPQGDMPSLEITRSHLSRRYIDDLLAK